MAKTKRRSTAKRSASRKKKREPKRISAELMGIGVLFGGLLLMELALVPGSSVWRTLHDVLFGLFGCGALVLGPAICYLAILYTLGGEKTWEEEAGPYLTKLALGLIFACGTVIVFSDIEPEGLSGLEMLAACYENGVRRWMSGGAFGCLLGGSLLLLCGRPAANLIMVALALCVSLYIFELTPAEVWQWLYALIAGLGDRFSEAGGSLGDLISEWKANHQPPEDAQDEQGDVPSADEPEEPEEAPKQEDWLLGSTTPSWLSGISQWGNGQQEEQPARHKRETAAQTSDMPHPRAPFDVDLGPDHTTITKGGSETLDEPIIKGTFGSDWDVFAKLQHKPQTPPPPTVKPVVPDAIEVPTSVFFGQDTPEAERDPARQTDQPIETPVETVEPAEPAETTESLSGELALTVEEALQQEDDAWFDTAVSAQNDGGWISIDEEPTDESENIKNLAEVAMGKELAAEQAAAMAAQKADADEYEQAIPDETFKYQYPSVELFDAAPEESDAGAQEELRANAQKLVDTLGSFGVHTSLLDISRGPAVTRYEIKPEAGVKISRITALTDDIALNLAVEHVRMEAPIPGKAAVGIEVPNKKRIPVHIRSIFESQAFRNMTSPLGIALGKDIAGVAQVADLCKMPHLLIAGSTGSGKSVCVNSIIMSLLFRSSPEDVKLILIDPKVVELAEYNGIPHLLMPVITEPKKAAGALGSAVQEMERRYRLFAENNVRDIKSYNKLAGSVSTGADANTPVLEKMPYIAIVIDELADLMMVVGKDVEDSICRIAQKARAAGMHLIVATQRPSVDVITGLIKANIPSRIAFAVSSQVDSRTILDGAGAEKLLGMGDMLFMPVGAAKPLRIQGTFVKDEEITRVLDFIKQSATVQYDEAMIEAMEKHAIQDGKKGSASEDEAEDGSDPMLKQCVEVVIDAGQASTSLLQRRCKLGYARAARIMDEMEQKGIIGPYEGAKPRSVLISRQQWLEMSLNQPENNTANQS